VSIEKIVDNTEGHTGADIASFVQAAIMLVMREHIAKYASAKEAEGHA
jgi:SpoVK/Ycf46/Vps4 family AAA+-type ATPase